MYSISTVPPTRKVNCTPVKRQRRDQRVAQRHAPQYARARVALDPRQRDVVLVHHFEQRALEHARDARSQRQRQRRGRQQQMLKQCTGGGELARDERFEQIEAGARLECDARDRSDPRSAAPGTARPSSRTNSSAHRKSGMASDKPAKPSMASSGQRPRKYTAARPKPHAELQPRSAWQTDTSSSVAGSLPSTSAITCSRRLMELPKSPRSDLPEPGDELLSDRACRVRTDAAAARCPRLRAPGGDHHGDGIPRHHAQQHEHHHRHAEQRRQAPRAGASEDSCRTSIWNR